MTKMDDLMAKARKLIEKLDFDGCAEMFEKLPSGHPMMDLLFDRMEALDPDRYEDWLME